MCMQCIWGNHAMSIANPAINMGSGDIASNISLLWVFEGLAQKMQRNEYCCGVSVRGRRKNMKKMVTYVAVLLVGLAGGVLLCGCASTRIERLSGEEFMGRAGAGKMISSFHWTSYVGCSSQRAYLEHGSAPFAFRGSRTTVFWTPLSELPKDIAEQLRAGDPPWKPRHSQTNRTERTTEATLP